MKRASSEGQRVLAMVGYGLLFVGVFSAGLSSLGGVLLAYGQVEESAAPLQDHFRGQIRIFWRGFWAWLLGFAALGAAIWFGSKSGSFGLDLENGWRLATDSSGMTSLVLTVSGIALPALGTLYSMLASALGFIRLASSWRES